MNIQKLILYGPLPIRILAGLAFIAHGIPKLSDPAMTQGFFGNIGLPPELAILIGLLEVIGGFALLVGIVTRIIKIHNRNDWSYYYCQIVRRFRRRLRIRTIVNFSSNKLTPHWPRQDLYRI